MEDKKITELPAASTLSGAELFEVVQGGVNKQATVDLILGDLGEEDYVQAIVDTTGDTITLNLASKSWGNFSGSATIAAPREVILANEERAGFYHLNFEVGVADVPIDFGDNTDSNSALFVDGVFTPQDVGLHTVHALRRYGTTRWLLTFRGVYSVGDAPPTPTDQWVLSTGIWNDSEFWDNDAIWRNLP
jgi:hypothetical protein